MHSLKTHAQQAEGVLSRLAIPLKPYIPFIARFLLVATFIEDSLHILFNWDKQVGYLVRNRKIWNSAAQVFLVANVGAMLVCSALAVARKQTKYAAAGLFCAIASQTLGYNILNDAHQMLRNLSVVGGLLLLYSEGLNKEQSLFPGLPRVSDQNKSIYLQLVGRMLLVLLFLSIMLVGEMSFGRIIVTIVGIIACIMVVIGFHTKRSATFLVLFLSVSNLLLNDWWNGTRSPEYMKYEFFQCLSVIGGFLLLSNIGPGGMSIDERKKMY